MRPYDQRIHLIRDIINESCFIAIFISSYPLLGNPSNKKREECGVSIVSAIIIILIIEMIFMFIEYIQMI